ncbi:MAG TPA: hypothetical protein VFK14_07045 [Solirubrobacterales bacterium]|nr:hypothetical protein [Solirubrobacterales bacterium]
MVSLAAADLLLGGDFSPESIESFINRSSHPLSELREARRELANRQLEPLVPALAEGETRPLARDTLTPGEPAAFLDVIWASLLYAHSVAIFDPLEESPLGLAPLPESFMALQALNLLATVGPLVEAKTLVLVPRDLLPATKLDFRRVERRLEGLRAEFFGALKGELDSDPHLLPRVSNKMRDLEFVAQTGWAVQIEPITTRRLGPLPKYAVNALLRDGRRRRRRQQMNKAFLGQFDSFALDRLTRVPVPDLSDLTVGDIQLIRDENAFGGWRRQLTGVVAEYERNLQIDVREADAIAHDRLLSSLREIDRTIAASSALSAIRAGLSTFAVAGSATLASFPVLSVEGRHDALTVAVGTSLLETGRRLVLCEKDPTQVARQRHHRAAATIFTGTG